MPLDFFGVAVLIVQMTKKFSPPIERPVQSTSGLTFPGELEKNFRRSLGRHNMHFTMLDISVQFFSRNLSEKMDKSKYLRECAKSVGHHSFYADAPFESARTFLVYSHIAYAFSAGDMLCKQIRSSENLKQIQSNHNSFIDNLPNLNFVKRTLALTTINSLPITNRDDQSILMQISNAEALASFQVINYYRLVRNSELHSNQNAVIDAWTALPKSLVLDSFKLVPSEPEALPTYDDALLCSKAWQAVARALCKKMMNDEQAMSITERRFRNLSPSRRKIAAQRFLELEFLRSKAEVDDIIYRLDWDVLEGGLA